MGRSRFAWLSKPRPSGRPFYSLNSSCLDFRPQYSTRPFLRGGNPHSARSYETDTKSSRSSEVRPKWPFAVLGLLGQANRGCLKGNLCRSTPARSHIPIRQTHGRFFLISLEPPHGAGDDTTEPKCRGGSGLRPKSPWAVLGLLG